MRRIVFMLFLIVGVQGLFAQDHIVTNRASQKSLPQTDQTESFTFAIFGDRTGGPESGLKILEHAVADVNVLNPDLVMTVGDLVQGYNQRPEWIKQAVRYTGIMDQLKAPWYPVAGNHDVYWRGKDRPEDEHEGDYEKYFGPLWYAFEHKGCWFVILYTDEGNPETGERNFKKPASQKMSQAQTDWLIKVLKKTRNSQHVFLFLHHPRWAGKLTYENYGNDWERIHKILVEASNVSAVFAGHTHRMLYNGKKEGIEYYTLGVTGGGISEDYPEKGFYHHYDLVTVRGSNFHVAALPVEAVLDPKLNLVKTQTILPEVKWKISTNEIRSITYPISIPCFVGVKGVLSIHFKHGADDSGDKGAYYSLIDSKGNLVQNEFSKSKHAVVIRQIVAPNEAYTFTITDQDTEFTGKLPGNGGLIKILLDIEQDKYQQPRTDPTLQKAN